MSNFNLPDFFKEVSLFSNMDKSEIEQITKICVERSFEKGKTIFYEQDQGTSFYLILSGQVKIVMMSNDGREHTLGVLKQKDFFGEVSMLDGQPRSATAIALSDVKTVTINRDDFHRILKANPEMVIKIMYVLCKRLRQADKHVESLAFLTATGRVARTLSNLADELGQVEGNKIIINHNMTRQDFANIAGTSRETFTRVIMDFQDEGLIEIDKSKIVLLDKKEIQKRIQ
ncbi:MAG: Crp/Fnr family transcriptional regulator [Candidatus Sericytochromatia bacterium]